MSKFEVIELRQSTTLYIWALRDEIDMNPSYQRMSDVWSKAKRQMLIDTLINGFDLPKIYFHEFPKPKMASDSRPLRYAVIDGKQRLQSIFEFMQNSLPLAPDFTYLADPSVDIRNMTYQELAKNQPRIKLQFDALQLPIFAIRTEDQETIEEMFSRLNEASPLNAAEKRNAYGGPIPPLVRQMVKHPFFTKKVSFSSTRYRHHDVATKLLYLTYRGIAADTKKVILDRFVTAFKSSSKLEVQEIRETTEQVLHALNDSFADNDPLLKSSGLIPVYFWVSKLKGDLGFDYRLDRSRIAAFDQDRADNRKLADSADSDDNVNYELIEFDRLVQSPNDSYSIRYRCELLAQRILPKEQYEKVLIALRPPQQPKVRTK